MNGIVYDDDSQVAVPVLECEKIFAEEDATLIDVQSVHNPEVKVRFQRLILELVRLEDSSLIEFPSYVQKLVLNW
jgi:hypothetical protein